jgi:hypothetical protein
MVKSFKISSCNINTVFRHRWDSKDKNERLENMTMWREYALGFWYKRSKIIGCTNFNNHKKWKSVNLYMFGFNGIVFKTWFTLDFNGKHFKEIK